MPQLGQRDRWHRGWLNRLSSMPSWMYRKVVEELMLGATPLTATKLIFDYPDAQRGGLQGLAFRTVQKYVQVLAEDVARQKRLQPPPTMAQVQAEVLEVVGPLAEGLSRCRG